MGQKDYIDQFEFEDSHLNSLPEFAWMVRPCEIYHDEYSDCKSIKGRFHQYYIYGEFIDCSQWKKNFDNCMKWRKNKDQDALKPIIQNELERKKQRMANAAANDIWELREEPPADWNRPLPSYLTRDHKISFLEMKQKERKGIDAVDAQPDKKTSYCTIS